MRKKLIGAGSGRACAYQSWWGLFLSTVPLGKRHGVYSFFRPLYSFMLRTHKIPSVHTRIRISSSSHSTNLECSRFGGLDPETEPFEFGFVRRQNLLTRFVHLTVSEDVRNINKVAPATKSAPGAAGAVRKDKAWVLKGKPVEVSCFRIFICHQVHKT